MKNKKVVSISLILMLMLFVVAGYLYNKNKSDKLTQMAQEKASLFKRDASFTQGSDDAKVQLVEFFDPACETCAQFHPYIKEIMKENDGKIQLVLRYAPFHNGSVEVVKMLEATKRQGLFMKTLEMTFGMQRYWTVNHQVRLDILWSMLPRVGLDMEKLIDDMKDPEITRIVEQDIEDAATLGATKTPSK